MSGESSKSERNYTKKEEVINCWLVADEASISEIAEAVDCSYEYARRIIRKIESSEIDPEKHSIQDLQDICQSSLREQGVNRSVKDFIHRQENQSSVESVPTAPSDQIDDEAIDIEIDFSTNQQSDKNTKSEVNGDNEDLEIDTDQLRECLPTIIELQNQARFYLKQDKQWAYGQYFVAQRASQLVQEAIEEYNDGSIPKFEVWTLIRIFEEFYHEAEYEEDLGKKGSEQKKYTAYRIVTLLNSIYPEG